MICAQCSERTFARHMTSNMTRQKVQLRYFLIKYDTPSQLLLTAVLLMFTNIHSYVTKSIFIFYIFSFMTSSFVGIGDSCKYNDDCRGTPHALCDRIYTNMCECMSAYKQMSNTTHKYCEIRG
jgi:hypothetical protein